MMSEGLKENVNIGNEANSLVLTEAALVGP